MNRILPIIGIISVLSLGFVAGPQAKSMAQRGFAAYETTHLVGLTVEARDGVQLGRIYDLIVDSNGHVDFAIVDQFTPPDLMEPLPGHLAAVQFSAFTISKGKSQEPQVVLSTDKEKFYPLDGYLPVRTDSMAQRGFTTYETTHLVGLTVESRDGVQLGRIFDFIVDSNGNVDFAVIAQPGVEDSPGRLVAVPFSTLMLQKRNSDKISVIFKADKEKFCEGPDLSDISPSNPRQVASVDRYYGVQPYWTGPTGKQTPINKPFLDVPY